MLNAMAFKSDHREGLLRGNPSRFKHVHAVIFGGWLNVGDLLLTVVEAVPYLAPIAACGRLAIFGRAGFEEVGVLDAVQQWREPWQRVVFDHVDGLEAKLSQAPIGDVADVAFDFLGGHAGDGAHFEREVDEIIFQTDNLLAAIDNVFLHRLGEAATLRAEGVEQLGDAFAVQALVADGPGYDLPHALHLVEAWEVHQHREGCEQLQPFGKAAEHRERAGNVFVAVDAELVDIIDLGRHFFIFKERRIFGFWHTDGVEQVAVRRDMDGFHVGKGGEHHLDFGRLEHAAIMFVVAILHLDIGLREETENLRQKVALMVRQFLRPIAAIFAQGHFFGQPMDLLLAFPEVIGPRIFKGLVAVARL